MKVIMAKFLMEFDFDLDTRQPFGMQEVATIKPKSDVNVTLVRRYKKSPQSCTPNPTSTV